VFCDGLLVFVVVWGLSLPSLSCFVSVQSGEVVKIYFFLLPDLCRSLRIRE
jgi:hypothetical protein